MADSLSANPAGKAAVVVIDNQFGLGNIGVKAEHLDEIWRQITQGMLGKRYDEVVIILGHHPETENNPIVNALSAATKRFGAVDMYTMMHTNMVSVEEGIYIMNAKPGLAQIPLASYVKELLGEQRSRLRFLYSMGCGDGNFMAADMAAELGFKVFAGHEGTTINTIATYEFLSRLYSGASIKNAASETNDEMKKCLPQVGGVIAKHMDVIKPTLSAFLNCYRGDGKEGEAKAADKGGEGGYQCIAAALPALLPIMHEIVESASQCIPSAKEEFGHIEKPMSAFEKMLLGMRNLPAENEQILDEILPLDAKQKATKMAERMRLVIFGDDLSFDGGAKPMKILPRKEKIRKILDYARDKKNHDFSNIANMCLAVAILRELNARDALREIAGASGIMGEICWLARRKLVEMKDVSYFRRDFMHNGNDNGAADFLLTLGDSKYLKKILWDPKADQKLRLVVAEVFAKKGLIQDIRGGVLKELDWASLGDVYSDIFEKAKSDPSLMAEFESDFVELYSDYLIGVGPVRSFVSKYESAPELAVKIAKKMGSKKAVHDTEGEYNRVVIAAFLFDKGMLTADEARTLSSDWIREYKKPGMSWGEKWIDGFDHEAVLRKIHGLPVK